MESSPLDPSHHEVVARNPSSRANSVSSATSETPVSIKKVTSSPPFTRTPPASRQS